MESTEHRSRVFELSDAYVETMKLLYPISATHMGDHSYDNMLDDFSFEGDQKELAVNHAFMRGLEAAEPIDDIDRIAKKIFVDGLKDFEDYVLNDYDGAEFWGVVDSPVSSIRMVFDFMKHETQEDLDMAAERLYAVPKAYARWIRMIGDLESKGRFTWAGHAVGVAKEVVGYSYKDLMNEWDPNKTHADVHSAAIVADNAGVLLSAFLEEYASRSDAANTSYAAGEERYIRYARNYTGLTINPREVYESGLKELDEINARMWELGRGLYPDMTSLKDLADRLNADDRYMIDGNDNLIVALNNITEEAIKMLDGTHFNIDPKIRQCDTKLVTSPDADASPYYTDPSEDLTRPGTAWYPTQGKTKHALWYNVSTWYHEGVPGHHLQFGTSAVQKERLSRYQRNYAWESGYGEGWALYAERFMYDLGVYKDNPVYEIGYLLNQALRAARLVIDIGLHLNYINEEHGRVWLISDAIDLLVNRAMLDYDYAESEVYRYLAWPGQAISYKIGERAWIQYRDEAKERLGDKFDLKKFHTYALNIGPMGLDMLQEELAKWDGN